MKPEHEMVETLGLFRIHTHYYASPAPQGTVILVNGSLATMAAFAQTVRFLQPHFNVVLFDEPYSGESKAYNGADRAFSGRSSSVVFLGRGLGPAGLVPATTHHPQSHPHGLLATDQ